MKWFMIVRRPFHPMVVSNAHKESRKLLTMLVPPFIIARSKMYPPGPEYASRGLGYAPHGLKYAAGCGLYGRLHGDSHLGNVNKGGAQHFMSDLVPANLVLQFLL